MSRNDTSVKEQLQVLNWSIDDLLAHCIIESYERFSEKLNRDMPGEKNKRARRKLRYDGIKSIPVTRQTLYNMIRGSHETRLDVATLVRDVINDARKFTNSSLESLDFSELNIRVYEKKKS